VGELLAHGLPARAVRREVWWKPSGNVLGSW
jgi:hypothetical protein